MSFKDLNLHPTILEALAQRGYTQPTPIQKEAIPRALAGVDLIATAQTGTGKTAAFVLPALQLLATTPHQKLPRILILTPTRELADQVMEAVRQYSKKMQVKVVSILGGMPYGYQLRALSQALDIIVATPGRLIDHLKSGKLNLSQIKMLVLDEADRMLDMGFIDDVKQIAQAISQQHQTLLFTATIDKKITQLAHTILHKPEQISIASKTVALEKIQQIIYIADDKNHKDRLLAHLLQAENVYKAIIFCATKHHSDKLARQLRDQGYAAGALHGDMNQRKRNFAINDFRTGKLNILVATDVAARGIDVSDVSHVINYDIPRGEDDYIHRIGRTGRAGKEGIAITFVLGSERGQLKRIEKFLNATLALSTIPGLEAKQTSYHPPHKAKKSHFRGGHRQGQSDRNQSRRKPTDGTAPKVFHKHKRFAKNKARKQD